MALALRIKTRIKYALSIASGYVSWFFNTALTATQVPDKTGQTRTPQSGRYYNFDGTDDYADIGNVGDSIRSICFRIKCDDITSHTDYVIDLNGTDYITIVNGTVTVNGFSGATTNIYVDGSAGSTIANTTDFHNVIITSDLGFTASDLDIGRLEGTGFFDGGLYDVRLFTVELSSGERGSIDNFASVTTGLSCWFKMDEQNGTVMYDSNGGTNDGTLTNITVGTFHATSYKVGFSWQNRYGYTLSGSTFIPRDEITTNNDVTGSLLGETGQVQYNANLIGSNSADFDGTDDYADIGNVGDSIRSICFRIKCDDITSHTDYVIDLNGTDYITIVNGTVTVNGFSGATTNIYVDGSAGSTIANTTDFHNVIITSDLGFTASDLDIGRLEGTGFFDGGLCDVRLFTVELSSEERESIDNKSNVTNGLSCHFPFAEGNGSINFDVSGNGNHGTLTNISESTFWGTPQNIYHYNLLNGFFKGKNAFTKSQEIDHSDWTKSACTITADTVTAPDSTTTADKIVEDTTTNFHGVYQAKAVSGLVTWSCYVKAAGRTKCGFLTNNDGLSDRYAYFDLAALTTHNVNAGFTANIEDVGDGWRRISVTSTASESSAYYWLNATDSISVMSHTGDGTSGIYVWGAQLEDATSITTDVISQGKAFDHSDWTKSACTITADTVTAPDSTTTADKIVEDTTTNFHGVYQAKAVSGLVTWSCYVKAAGRTKCGFLTNNDGLSDRYAYFDLAALTTHNVNAGFTANIEDVGDGWRRISVTSTASESSAYYWLNATDSISVMSHTGDGTSGIYVWGCQLEYVTNASEYQQTTTASTFRISVPAKLDGLLTANGGTITNPAGVFHNNCETKIKFPEAPLLFNVDISNFLFDVSGNANEKEYSDFVEDVQTQHKILMDVSTPNQIKNLLMYENAISGSDLGNTQTFLNH